MSRDRDRKGPGNRGGLSEEDIHLWQHTARSITPAQRLKARVHPALAEDGRPADVDRMPLKHATRILDQPHPPRPHTVPHPVQSRQGAAKAPPLGDFDRRKARKLGSGQVDIEARIDLHGLRQGEAHAALRRFIAACHARGCRWVLVITGKGAPAGARQRDDRPWSADDMGWEDRGVLRRNVPRWLAEADLRLLVVSYTTAAVRHGGDGALYVHLRNPDRVRR